jgi:cytidylate kinase
MQNIPVIAIDGPSASGKGTVAERVARALGFHYLDSGALYRLVALAALRADVPWSDEAAVAGLAAGLDARFESGNIYLSNQDVTEDIRSELCGRGASQVAVLPAVRKALLERQRAYAQAPGLVADGRDMGSVVFPSAALKVFLTAALETRADRRHKQLKQKGITANIDALLKDLRERDERDSSRSVAPLKRSPDAHWLDTSALSAEQAAERVLQWYGSGTAQ